MKKAYVFITFSLFIFTLPLKAEERPHAAHAAIVEESAEEVIDDSYDPNDPNITAVYGEDSSPLEISDYFLQLKRHPNWELEGNVKLKFKTYHPQGLIKIGDYYYISSVEVLKKPAKLSGGEICPRGMKMGRGHFYKVDGEGNLVQEMILGDSKIFHPGGLDYDGKYIWIPVGEYQAGGVSIVYRLDPETWEAKEMFRANDHIGALVYYPEANTLIGMNWGADKFYEWNLQGKLLRRVSNETSFIAYQDCKHAGNETMICSGHRNNHLGGLDLISFKTLHKMKSIASVPRCSDTKKLMTRNPMALAKTDDGVLYYFLPSDNDSTLYTYKIR